MKIIITALAALAALAPARAAEVCFTNLAEGDAPAATGYGALHYEAAMRIDDDRLPGKQISAVEWQLYDVEALDNVELFLAYRLDSSLRPVYTQAVDVPADGKVRVDLATPFDMNVTSIYVGYRMDCADSEARPLSTVERSAGSYAYIYRTAASGAWTNASGQALLDMKVYLAGDFGTDAVTLGAVPELNVVAGETARLEVPVYNAGTSQVQNVAYRWTLGPHSGSGVCSFDPPVAATVGSYGLLGIDVPASDAPGEYEASAVEVTAVNGVECSEAVRVSYNVIAYRPAHRPLVEEYTGAWCGACVLGLASMEMMTDKYGDDFVLMAIHDTDRMTIMDSYPCGSARFPSIWLDRQRITHPCYGDSEETPENVHASEAVWQQVRDEFTPVDLELQACWADDSRQAVEVKAKVKTVRTVSGSLRVGYALVADGMTGERWNQTNYLSGYSYDDPYLSKYTAQPNPITNFTWDDVTILFPETTGVAGSLPAQLVPGAEYEHSYSLPLSQAVNVGGLSLVQDKDRMRVVAFVYNEGRGAVLNSAKAPISGGSGVSTGMADKGQPAGCEYFDLFGRRLAAPAAGAVSICRLTYADGTVRTLKVRP